MDLMMAMMLAVEQRCLMGVIKQEVHYEDREVECCFVSRWGVFECVGA